MSAHWEKQGRDWLYTNFGYDQIVRITSAGRGRYRIDFNCVRQNKRYHSLDEAKQAGQSMCDTAPEPMEAVDE